MCDMVTIDGSQGEGGGQIVRTALALSLVTGRGFRIVHLRARRTPPGLRPQHLVAVSAAAEIGAARVEGAAIGSQSLGFVPGRIVPGDFHFAIGTAGSVTLVLQTLLPALMLASAPSTLVLEGGTHNPLAPTFDFIARAFLPLVNRMGPRVEAKLERPGFYPRGGGRMRITIQPPARLVPLELCTRGVLRTLRATAIVAGLPRHIAERELAVAARGLGLPPAALAVRELPRTYGPGNVLTIDVESEHVTEVFAGFGERGVPAEAVAQGAVDAARRYLATDVPVGEHLADQLLIPGALAGSGGYRTLTPSLHTRTNIDIVKQFLPVDISLNQEAQDVWSVSIAAPGGRKA